MQFINNQAYMNFIEGFKNFDLFIAINKITGTKNTQNSLYKPQNSLTQLIIPQEIAQPSQLQSIQFMLSLRKSIQQQQKRVNVIKRKISIFDKLQIEPLYLEYKYERRIIQFQFQLGTQNLLDRVETLYNQMHQVELAIEQVLFSRQTSLIQAFDIINNYHTLSLSSIEKLSKTRNVLKNLSLLRENKIVLIQRRKNCLKGKLKLLKNVKQKNEIAFIKIDNIDQAFFTQRSRLKMYKQTIKSSELNHSSYIAIFNKRLITIANNNRMLVESQLKSWVEGKLTPKQIQKLAIMIYFIQTQDMYRLNQIRIDYSTVNKQTLRQQVERLKEWNDYRYIQDASMKDRIYEFLNFLTHKLQ